MPLSMLRSRPTTFRAGAAAAALLATSIGLFAQGAAGRPSVGKSVKVGTGLYEIAASPSTGLIYVASAGARNEPGAAVFALDGNTLDVVRTFDVTAAAAYGLSLNDRTQTLYTTNTREGSVSAIDLKTGEIRSVKSEADTSAHLREIVVDEASNTIYASSYGQAGMVWVIDGSTNTLAHTIQNVGNGTAGLVVDKQANRLWVSNMSAHEVAAIDLATRLVVQRFPAGGERPSNLAFDPKTRRLFVANQGPGTVTVLDSQSGKLLATIPTGAGALDVEFNPVTNLGYAANRTAGTTTVFDGSTFEIVANLQTGGAPNTLAIDSKTGLVYVTLKTRPAGRGRGQGAAQGSGAVPAAPAAAPVEDQNGDTVVIIRP